MADSTLPVGTPLWAEPLVAGASSTVLNTKTRAVHPEETDATTTVFMGVTTREGEPITGQIPIVREGRALVRVMGPINANEAVGFSEGNTYLVKNGSPSTAAALEAIAGAEVKLIMVNLGQGASGGETLIYTYIVKEGRDALLCSQDYIGWGGDAESIIVMKPSDLQVSVKTASPLKFGRNQTVTLDTAEMDAMAFWANRGMIVNVVDNAITNEEFDGANSGKQRQATWPMYCNAQDETNSDRLGLVIQARNSSLLYTGIVAFRSAQAVGRVNPDTLLSVTSGGVLVYHIDMNVEKRSWKTISEIIMTQRTKYPDDSSGLIYNE